MLRLCEDLKTGLKSDYDPSEIYGDRLIALYLLCLCGACYGLSDASEKSLLIVSWCFLRISIRHGLVGTLHNVHSSDACSQHGARCRSC